MEDSSGVSSSIGSNQNIQNGHSIPLELSLGGLDMISPALQYTQWLALLRETKQLQALMNARISQIRLRMLSSDELDLCYKDAVLAASWDGNTVDSNDYVATINECLTLYSPDIWLVDEAGNRDADIKKTSCPEKSRLYKYGRFHYQRSYEIFQKVGQFYQNALESKESDLDENEILLRWQEVFKVQLSTPHEHLDDTFSLYSSFASKHDSQNYETLMLEGNKIYKKTKQLMRYYETLEMQLLENPKDIETWKAYIQSVKKYQPEAVEVLFWRSKEYFEPGDYNWFRLWIFYLDLMKEDYFGDPKEEFMLIQFQKCFSQDPTPLGVFLLTIGNKLIQGSLDTGELNETQAMFYDIEYARRAVSDYMLEIKSDFQYKRWKFVAMVLLAIEASISNSKINYYSIKFLQYASERDHFQTDSLVEFISKLVSTPHSEDFWSLLNASSFNDYSIDILQRYVDIDQMEPVKEPSESQLMSRKRPRLDSATSFHIEPEKNLIHWVQMTNLPHSMDNKKLQAFIGVDFFDSEYLDNGSTVIFKVQNDSDFQKVSELNGIEYDGKTILVEQYERPTLWCSHFPDDFSRSELDKMFYAFGKVIKTVHPHLKKYCFYVFEDPLDAKNAIHALNKKTLLSKDGKKYILAVHRASKAFNQAKEPIRDRQVFVNRLNFKTTIDNVKTAFLVYGEIEKVLMPTGIDGNANKGFAKIIYSSSSAANAALAMNGVEVDERRLAVTLDNSMGSQHASNHLIAKTQPSKSVVIMPFNCSQDEAYSLVWKLIGPIELVKSYPDSTAFLFEFGSEEDAKNAQKKLADAGLSLLKVLSEEEYIQSTSATVQTKPKRRLMVPTSIKRRNVTKSV